MSKGRKKIPQNIAIRADLSDRLNEYLKKPLAPSKTSAWEYALERFLDKEEKKEESR